jgi:hypothetical protein
VICPTGARQNILSSLKRKTILIFRISDLPYGPVPRPSQGASRDRRERGAECGGRVGAVRRAASARTAKSCGPGALRLGAQGVARLQRRRGDDGGNSAQFTGEHAISRNPLRREGRGVSAVPVVNARSRNLLCAGAPGACGHPAFPVPSRFEGYEDARLGRKASRECNPVAAVLSWPILRDAASRLPRMRS